MTAQNDNQPLTAKRERFCREYVVDLNATAAARRSGYSAKTAHVQGPRLLANVRVASRIAELQGEAARRNKITVDNVVAELQRLRDLAIESGQMGPAVRAQELTGKTIGAFVDRHTVTEVSELSDSQLVSALAGDDELLRQRLRQLLGPGEGFGDTEGSDCDSVIH